MMGENGLRKLFRARRVPCNYVLFVRQQTTGLPLFGEGCRMEEGTVSAGLSVHSDLMLEVNYPDKRRSGNVVWQS